MQIDISGMHYEFTCISAELMARFRSDDAKRLFYWAVRQLLSLGAKANPKVAYLAYHAKTQRARIKNQKRLYKLGCLAEKRGEMNVYP